MTTSIRQLTQKGDPQVRVVLPEFVVSLLQDAAKQNKRRVQDQFIKVLTETFKHEPLFTRFSESCQLQLQSCYSNK